MFRRPQATRHCAQRAGFTLIEVLLVLIILVIYLQGYIGFNLYSIGLALQSLLGGHLIVWAAVKSSTAGGERKLTGNSTSPDSRKRYF